MVYALTVWYALTVEESTRMSARIRNTHSLAGIMKSEQITASVRFNNDVYVLNAASCSSFLLYRVGCC